MPPATITHTFQYYPPLRLAVSQIDLETPTRLTAEELQIFRRSWFKSIEPLLKHIEQPEQVRKLLSAFNHAPVTTPVGYAQPVQIRNLWPMTSANLWKFVEDIAYLFPDIIATQIDQTITNTAGSGSGRKRRNRWIRKRLLKDLKCCETHLTAMRDAVVLKIVDNEQNERDQRLLVLDHILKNILQEGDKSIKAMIEQFAS